MRLKPALSATTFLLGQMGMSLASQTCEEKNIVSQGQVPITRKAGFL
jgi:hypothetical protein